MSTIVTRSGKGSALTHTEMDANFTNLNTDKYQSGDTASFAGISLTGLSTQASETTALMINGSNVVGTRDLGTLAFSSATYDNYSSWTLTADSGTNQTVGSGNTVDIAGGTYITTAVAATDTVTVNHDNTTRTNNTSTASPAHGGNFTVIDSISTNTTGHVTAVNTKTVTLPADNNTDTLQTIANDTTNADRYITFVTNATGAQTGSSNANLRFNPSTGLLSATSKSFDIAHPTKEGMRLRYGSLEGPEQGVYVRGKLKNTKIIVLPDYWTGLVDESTITVNLTAVGFHTDLWVKEISGNKIYVESSFDIFECFYHVFAERKDIDKLTVEYSE